MEYQVLGPLKATHQDTPVVIGGARQLRLALAALLSRAGQPTNPDWLIAALWADRAPPTARRNVQVLVYKLRRALGEDQIVGWSDSYMIPACVSLDSRCFRERAARGSAALDNGETAEGGRLLRSALDLWRGPAFTEFVDCEPVAAEAASLEELRVTVYERWAQARLAVGHHRAVVDELGDLVRAHPYREALAAQLMCALTLSGSKGEALGVFERTRQVLREQLGADPGPVLRRLHGEILRDEAGMLERLRQSTLATTTAPESRQRISAADPMSTAGKPAQLPMAVRGFSGRSVELDRLDAMLAGSGDPSNAVTVIVISGMGGVGKTALALHWARRIAGRYPDGQLYLDLRGQSDDDQLTPIAALARLLQAFGLKPEQVPADPVAAAGLFRSTVAGRRLLIVLDNARSTDQVRPLLPGGDGCAVIVTSRHRLGDLRVHDGALAMDLDGLRPAEAEHLLSDLLGDAHRSEESAVAEIARLCGYLPLALRIAAARLAEQPERGSAWLRDELAGDDRLGALQIDGDEGVAVRAAFDLSYRSVPRDIQRLFTLLGLFPGTDFGVDAVAALAGLPRFAARRALGHLATVHMIRARSDGRYDFHDLIREYARALAADCEQRDVARDRLYTWYTVGADKAARILHPHFLTLSQGPPQQAGDPDLPDSTAARTWLDNEFAGLVAAIRHGVHDGQAEASTRLADALRGYLVDRATLCDWLAITDAAMAAARAVGDLRAEVAAHMHAATAYGLRDDYQRSIHHLKLAIELAQRVGWTMCATMAQANLAGVHLRTGEIALAHRVILQAKDTFGRLGDQGQVTSAMLNLGVILVEMGRPTEAVETLTEVFARADEFTTSSRWASSLETYGLALYQSGQRQLARERFTQSLEHARQLGNHALETQALTHLAHAASDEGRCDEAWDLADQAATSARVCGQPRIEAVTLNLTAFLHIREGDGAAAIVAAARAYELASGVGARRPEIEALINLASGHHLVGEHGIGAESARRAYEVAAKCGYEGLVRQAAEILAQRQGVPDGCRVS